mmetsp:Transcript_17759/g.26608  ORF Transcript_17759/g.26608 Transcript_17759/m.26608 type:complete len:254 (-) Transcript_17759:70-831(-)
MWKCMEHATKWPLRSVFRFFIFLTVFVALFCQTTSKLGSEDHSVCVVLEKAHLKLAKVKGRATVLNAMDHESLLSKDDQDLSLYRPDILHQALLAILDSPLNKAGKVGPILIRTTSNQIISVHPSARIPRTARQFGDMMGELLQKMSVKSQLDRKKLLHFVRGPITDHLPLGAPRLAFSFSAANVTDMHKFMKQTPNPESMVLIVGAMAQGSILDLDSLYVYDKAICMSNYPLSAACTLSRLLAAVENRWKIV